MTALSSRTHYFLGAASLALALALAGCAAAPAGPVAPRRAATAGESARYAALARMAQNDPKAYAMLESLLRAAPRRLAGTPGAAAAEAWGFATLQSLGFEAVRSEPVRVPVWIRGDVEEVMVLGADGAMEPLRACALGLSPGTSTEGVLGEVVEVRSLEEAASLGERGRGKVIFYNRPMNPELEDTFAAYGGAVDQRGRSGYVAKQIGAVGALVRSMTTRIDDHPHTGAMRATMDDGSPVAPSAAISTRAAERLHGLLQQGPVRVRMRLSCRAEGEGMGANIVGELRGSERPQEVVVVGGHLDAWETGDGAHDDGAGIVHSIEALRLLKAAGLRPKRTVRVVLFANEESGLRGGQAYAEAHRTEPHFFGVESDRGGFAPHRFQANWEEPQFSKLADALAPLAAIGCAQLARGGGGADLTSLERLGVSCGELIPDCAHYFDYHHAETDVLAAVDREDLERGALALAYFVDVVANW